MAIVQSPFEAGPSRTVGSIFTDLPNFSCPFTHSPTAATPSSPPTSSRRMAFPKIPIPPSSCSTDSEILSDGDYYRSTSPSLISSLFSRNPSSSCSTSSQATPVTPTGSHKPILRRPDCASASTSASEDCGRIFGERNGLGLSSMTSDAPILSRKRSTLTFAVKCSTTSDSGQSPTSCFRPCRNFAKSPARLPAWRDSVEEDEDEEDEDDDDLEMFEDLRSPVFDEESDPEDEGYEEDEEGGFTDDEDLVGTLTGQLGRLWVPSARWKATQVDVPRRRSTYDASAPTSDDGCPVLKERGRKISIVTSKTDRCPRHVSPPPSRASSPPPSTKSSCPPAARSPSAIGLCRRRETRLYPEPSVSGPETRGWRSDNGALGLATSGLQPQVKVSCPPPCSILRSTIPASPSPPRSAMQPNLKLSRRGSAPACSAISAGRCSSINRRDMREDARSGLEAYMRRGSEK